MFSSIHFRAKHEDLIKGLMKVYFKFHYSELFYKFGYSSSRKFITLEFGSPEIGDYSYNDFLMVFTELEDICSKQECEFVLVSFCFHPYVTFFC